MQCGLLQVRQASIHYMSQRARQGLELGGKGKVGKLSNSVLGSDDLEAGRYMRIWESYWMYCACLPGLSAGTEARRRIAESVSGSGWMSG